MDCLFCDIIDGKKTGHFIYEDNSHVAFLDRYPIDVGHSLVLPREHHEKITDMSAEKVGELFSKIPKIVNGVLKATNADAFSLGQNNGKAAKQIIPHVHVHIIPRYDHKGTVWTKRGISNDNELNELAKKIHGIINSTF
ncbi:MAG TPA: HIT family protein [Nitrosopumilaceae archaeon]|nr:HIT family protein [Nitrosopumilaceae archaeon]